jgi:mRNA interferase MazF
MTEGDIVLTPIPQSDGQIKSRPGLFLRVLPPYGDMLICGISTQLHQQVIAFDEIVASMDIDFPTSGLRETSLIRLGFLSVVPSGHIIGSIGSVSPDRHRRLLDSP